MTKEIIQISVGGCGNQLGQTFWKDLSREHGINDQNGIYQGSAAQEDQHLQGVNVYYNESMGGSFVPRSVLVDLDPTNPTSSSMFRADNSVIGQSGAANNWAMGYHSAGA